MTLIIAGGRDYHLTEADNAWLDDLHHQHNFTEVVSGGARGADKSGELWAAEKGLPVRIFAAEWYKHGKAAGPLRNIEMAKHADALAVFPGGRGTANMIREAKDRGLIVWMA